MKKTTFALIAGIILLYTCDALSINANIYNFTDQAFDAYVHTHAPSKGELNFYTSSRLNLAKQALLEPGHSTQIWQLAPGDTIELSYDVAENSYNALQHIISQEDIANAVGGELQFLILSPAKGFFYLVKGDASYFPNSRPPLSAAVHIAR